METKYLLMACVEREDGTTFEQLITYLNEAQRHNTRFINYAIDCFKKMLGRGYYVANTWIE